MSSTASTSIPPNSATRKETCRLEADVDSDKDPTECEHCHSPISYGSFIYYFPESYYSAPLETDLEDFLSKVPEGQAKEDLKSFLWGGKVGMNTGLRTVRIAHTHSVLGSDQTDVTTIFRRSGQHTEDTKDLPLVKS